MLENLVNTIRSFLGINWQEDLTRYIQEELAKGSPICLNVHSEKQVRFGEEVVNELAEEIPGGDADNITFYVDRSNYKSPIGMTIAGASRKDGLVLSSDMFLELLLKRFGFASVARNAYLIKEHFEDGTGLLVAGMNVDDYFFLIEFMNYRRDFSSIVLIVRDQLASTRWRGYRIPVDCTTKGFISALKKLKDGAIGQFIWFKSMFSLFEIKEADHEKCRIPTVELEALLQTLQKRGVEVPGVSIGNLV